MKASHKICAVLSALLLMLAWFGGTMRSQSSIEARLASINADMHEIKKLDGNLYTAATSKGEVFIALAEHPGYAGLMHTAIVVNADGVVESVAILESPDTRPYIQKILDAALPDAFLKKNIRNLPQPDAISGATMSSTALLKSVQKAAQTLGEKNFGMAEKPNTSTPINIKEFVKCLILFVFFGAALLLSSGRIKTKSVWLRRSLLFSSVLVLGFLYSMQFSLSTVSVLLSGSWLKGIASYAPVLCLLLAVSVFLFSKKNLYCASICPFGALQESISLITSCSAPHPHPVMVWTARFAALGALCLSLYFRDPSLAAYDPFGKTFNMVGSGILFILSILIILSSLVFKRPWCRLFCPVTPFFDYLQFWRQWIFKKKIIISQKGEK